MKKLLLAFFLMATNFLFFASSAFAQTEQPEMADVMRSNGKIYVVVAVCLIILFGLIGYVIRIDRNLSKLENQSKD